MALSSYALLKSLTSEGFSFLYIALAWGTLVQAIIQTPGSAQLETRGIHPA